MKVFEVITEHVKEGDNEIHTIVEHVTQVDNSLLFGTKHFTRHCYEYGKDLKSVREVVVISRHID